MSNNKLEENINPAETIKRLSKIAMYKLRKPHTWDVVSTMQQRIVELLDWFFVWNHELLDGIQIVLDSNSKETPLYKILESLWLPKSTDWEWKSTDWEWNSKLYDGKQIIGSIQWWDKHTRYAIIEALDRISLMSSHEQSEKCEYLSQHDDLTGLLNRLGFFKIVNKTIKKDAPCVAMCFDLNQFKPINDTYWHAMGDKALRLFASVCSEVSSKYAGTIARTGGDEFMGIFPWKDIDDGQTIAQEIQDKLMSKFTIRAGAYVPDTPISINDIPFTVSIGITDATQTSKPTKPKEGTTPLQDYISKLIHRADKASLAAKKMSEQSHIAIWKESYDDEPVISLDREEVQKLLESTIRGIHNSTDTISEQISKLISELMPYLSTEDVQYIIGNSKNKK